MATVAESNRLQAVEKFNPDTFSIWIVFLFLSERLKVSLDSLLNLMLFIFCHNNRETINFLDALASLAFKLSLSK